MNISSVDLGSIYSDAIHFKDPIHDISGLPTLQQYMNDLCANLTSCRFEYLDELHDEGKAYIKWDMYFSHPKLKKGESNDGEHKVRGISEIRYDSKIYYHEDVYDMGAMIYEHVPLMGSVTQWLKGRLAK